MKVIRASEIGEYVFCHRAWWLHHVRGLASANVRAMQSGTAVHAGHGRKVGLASTLRTLAFLLVVIAILSLLASLFSFDIWHLGF
jgi:hypothetical protein